MKASLKKVGKWSQWIGSAALVLALGGLFAPVTTYAVTCDGCVGKGETIPVEGEAPFNPPTWGGHNGGGAPNGTPGGDMGGSGGGGVVPSGGGTSTGDTKKTAAERIADAKEMCEYYYAGTWTTNVIFHDKGMKKNKQLVGYRCSSRFENKAGPGLVYSWDFYDSRGNHNYSCFSSATYTNCPDGHTGG